MHVFASTKLTSIVQAPSTQASSTEEVQHLREKLQSTESYCTQIASELEKLKLEEEEIEGQFDKQRVEMAGKIEELGNIIHESSKREASLQKDLQVWPMRCCAMVISEDVRVIP